MTTWLIRFINLSDCRYILHKCQFAWFLTQLAHTLGPSKLDNSRLGWIHVLLWTHENRHGAAIAFLLTSPAVTRVCSDSAVIQGATQYWPHNLKGLPQTVGNKNCGFGGLWDLWLWVWISSFLHMLALARPWPGSLGKLHDPSTDKNCCELPLWSCQFHENGSSTSSWLYDWYEWNPIAWSAFEEELNRGLGPIWF